MIFISVCWRVWCFFFKCCCFFTDGWHQQHICYNDCFVFFMHLLSLTNWYWSSLCLHDFLKSRKASRHNTLASCEDLASNRKHTQRRSQHDREGRFTPRAVSYSTRSENSLVCFFRVDPSLLPSHCNKRHLQSSLSTGGLPLSEKYFFAVSLLWFWK